MVGPSTCHVDGLIRGSAGRLNGSEHVRIAHNRDGHRGAHGGYWHRDVPRRSFGRAHPKGECSRCRRLRPTDGDRARRGRHIAFSPGERAGVRLDQPRSIAGTGRLDSEDVHGERSAVAPLAHPRGQAGVRPEARAPVGPHLSSQSAPVKSAPRRVHGVSPESSWRRLRADAVSPSSELGSVSCSLVSKGADRRHVAGRGRERERTVGRRRKSQLQSLQKRRALAPVDHPVGHGQRIGILGDRVRQEIGRGVELRLVVVQQVVIDGRTEGWMASRPVAGLLAAWSSQIAPLSWRANS